MKNLPTRDNDLQALKPEEIEMIPWLVLDAINNPTDIRPLPFSPTWNNKDRKFVQQVVHDVVTGTHWITAQSRSDGNFLQLREENGDDVSVEVPAPSPEVFGATMLHFFKAVRAHLDAEHTLKVC